MPVIITNIFNTLLVAPIINLLVIVLHFLEGLGIPGALGFSVIIVTILIRMLIWPLMTTQLKSAKKMAELKPHLSKLKDKHKDDKQALSTATMALYKEHGVNPAGGCLPIIIQILVLGVFYNIISSLFGNQDGLNYINSLLYSPAWHISSPPDPNFFGFNLTDKPSSFATNNLLILIPIITALLTFVQSKMMVMTPVKNYPSDSPKEKKDKESMEDTMAAVQSQMIFMMPLMIGYFAFTLPIGISIYWNALTIVSIIQQHRVAGWGGMSDLIKTIKLKTAQ